MLLDACVLFKSTGNTVTLQTTRNSTMSSSISAIQVLLFPFIVFYYFTKYLLTLHLPSLLHYFLHTAKGYLMFEMTLTRKEQQTIFCQRY